MLNNALARLVALFVLVVAVWPMAGCGGAIGSATPGFTPVTTGSPNVGPPTSQTGRVDWTMDLAELGIQPAGRGGNPYEGYFFEVSLVYTGDVASGSHYSQTPFEADGTATITLDLRAGTWRLDRMAITRYGRDEWVNSDPVNFTVVIGENVAVQVTLVPATGTATFTVTLDDGNSDFTMDDLVSHDGERLDRNAIHEFTWSPVGAPGATSCLLYLDMLRYDSTGSDSLYTPADVVVTNFDSATMALQTTSHAVNGETVTRVTAISATPGTVVEFTVGLVPWSPLSASDYNRLQFGRVDNIQPPGVNYRVIGRLPITD